MFLVNLVALMVYYLEKILPLQALMFHGLKYYDHPMVTACTSTATCGPVHMFLDWTVKKYNDPTVVQEWWFPLVKLCIVASDWTVILSIFSIPVSIEIFKWMAKFDGTLKQGKTDYSNTQARYS